MIQASITVDGENIDGAKIVSAIVWLTSPTRKKILELDYEIVRLMVTNPTKVRWNIEQAYLLNEFHKKIKRKAQDTIQALCTIV